MAVLQAVDHTLGKLKLELKRGGRRGFTRITEVSAMTEPCILVADDSSTVRTQVSQILSKAGYGVATANDGAEAVNLAQRDLPTMMVLDVNMPTLDGFGVCLELRRMGAPWSEIPIVFLTSTSSHALEILGEEMGGYLRKPVREDELLHAVRAVMPCAAKV
jgi:DNA-binding response OmpR family regulator